MTDTSPLRIGLICPYSLTVPGGVQAQVLGLAVELRRRGHEARVLGPCDGPPPQSYVTPLGNSLPTSANGSMAPLAPDPSAALRTMRVLNDEAFDIVHIHEPLAPGPAISATLMHRGPAVGTFHAAGVSAGYVVLRPLLKRILERLDHRVVVSKDALALVRHHFGGDYEVLFNGVDLEAIRSAPVWTPDQVATTAGDHPIIFFCGRHERRKGLAVLLEAARELSPAVRVWVASDGPETATLRARHDDDERIVWLGRISDAEKFSRLRACDVFCAPSLSGESFGVVLVEAMAAGATVVASSLDGYRNVATDGHDAVLVPPGDADALAAALNRVLSDRALAQALRAAASTRADGFAMTALTDRYLEIYRRLVVGDPPVQRGDAVG
jgi:phosphatidylinositol alpha-mannosyltransferase